MLSGSRESEYGDITLDSFSNRIIIDVRIDSDGNSYLENFRIPPPIITYTETSPEPEKDVSIWGVAINKGYTFDAAINFAIETILIGEAADNCNASLPNLNDKETACMADQMGVDTDFFNRNYDSTWTRCKDRYNFLQRKKRLECLRSTLFVHGNYIRQELSLDHTELIIDKQGQVITQDRYCDFGGKCYDDSRRYWNDEADGRWKMRFPSSALSAGDKIRTKLRVFGDFTSSYDGEEYNISFGDNGWDSEFGNEVIIKDSSTFLKNSWHPLVDDTCIGFEYNRGKIGSHSGVDLPKPGGCIVRVINKGTVIFRDWDGSGGGNAVFVDHDDTIYTTYYLHGTGKYYISSDQKLGKGSKIMYMGNSGTSYGTHLHFTLLENGLAVDPEVSNKFGSMKYDEDFYNFSKSRFENE